MPAVLVHIPDRNIRVPMRTLTRTEIKMELDFAPVISADATLPAEIKIERVGSELRILDLDLGKRLGFARPIKIRDLIKRHQVSLEAMGTLPTVGTVNRGQQATEFYLNCKQAIFITAKSETAEATDITIEIIERFDAYENGYRPVAPVPQTREHQIASALILADEMIQEQKAQIAALAPKAEALDRIAAADGSFSVTEAAKALQVRPKDLFSFLASNGWTYRRAGSGTWLGYQTRTNAGDLEHRVSTVLQADGTERVFEQVKVTAQGLTKLAKLMPGRAVVVV